MPPASSVFLSPDVSGFRSRPSPPTGGQGLLVVGPLTGPLLAGQGQGELPSGIATLPSTWQLTLSDPWGGQVSTFQGPLLRPQAEAQRPGLLHTVHGG